MSEEEILELKNNMTQEELLNLVTIADNYFGKLVCKNLTPSEIIIIAYYIQSLVIINS